MGIGTSFGDGCGAPGGRIPYPPPILHLHPLGLQCQLAPSCPCNWERRGQSCHSSTQIPREYDFKIVVPSWLRTEGKGCIWNPSKGWVCYSGDGPMWPPNPATRWRQSSWKRLLGVALKVSSWEGLPPSDTKKESC